MASQQEFTGQKEELFALLQGWPGVYVGESLDTYLPDRWSRSKWEYVALLLGPSDQTGFERQFICKSGSKKGDTRGARSGPLVWLYPLESVPLESMVEVRSGVKGSPERYQRVYRRVPGGWCYLAYKRDDVVGWDKFLKTYRFRRFYPWFLVS